MKRERESGFNIKKIANFDVGKISKSLFNGDVGIIILMSLAGISHGLRDKHAAFANGRIFMIFASFLYLVVVQGIDVVSRWSRSETKKGFLTVRNMIELGFLLVLLAIGVATILTVFKGREDLTYNFLGVFGVIWILQCIRKLKNFSSTRDNVHKLIGPFLAIIILIFGCAMHHFLKGTVVGRFAGPVSFVLAPATMWICSLISGDIKGRSDGEDDAIHPLVGCAMLILLGFVVYAVFINPEVYGIEAVPMDLDTINRLLRKEEDSHAEALRELRAAEAKYRVSQEEADKLTQDLQGLGPDDAADEQEIRDFVTNNLDAARRGVEQAQQNVDRLKADFETKKADFARHKAYFEPLNTELGKLETDILTKGEEVRKLKEEQHMQESDPAVSALQGEIDTMNQRKTGIKTEVDNYKVNNPNFGIQEQDVTDAETLFNNAKDNDLADAQRAFDEANEDLKTKSQALNEKKAERVRKTEHLKTLTGNMQKEQENITKLQNNEHLTDEAKKRREAIAELANAHGGVMMMKNAKRQAKANAKTLYKTHEGVLGKKRVIFN